MIGKRIRELRKARKWSARELSERTNGVISRTAIATLECGRTNSLQLHAALAIAKAFGISVELLAQEESALLESRLAALEAERTEMLLRATELKQEMRALEEQLVHTRATPPIYRSLSEMPATYPEMGTSTAL